jgi:predicted nucleic acid-binding protein
MAGSAGAMFPSKESNMASDGMTAAIARVDGGRLATRNLSDFETTGFELTSPWST